MAIKIQPVEPEYRLTSQEQRGKVRVLVYTATFGPPIRLEVTPDGVECEGAHCGSCDGLADMLASQDAERAKLATAHEEQLEKYLGDVVAKLVARKAEGRDEVAEAAAVEALR